MVDPGPGTAAKVRNVLADQGLTLGGVLLTHGHFDHIWDAEELAEGTVPVYVPEPDLPALEEPLGALELDGDRLGLSPWRPISSVSPIDSVQFSPVPGINLRVIPAPGHSPGSAVYLVGAQGLDKPLAFSGDVVFAGSVGRTDIPGGDEYEMRESLRTLAASVEPQTELLPGHGPQTVWSTELAENLFVKRALARR